MKTFHTHCDTPATEWAEQHGYNVEKTDHKPIIDRAVPPTYESTGLTEGSHCAICGKVIVAQETIQALSTTIPGGFYMIPEKVSPIAVKSKIQLSAAVMQPEIIMGKLTWKSSNSKVASVDQYGVVTGKGAGEATITVTSKTGLRTSIDIQVWDSGAPVSVSIQADKTTIAVKEKLQLTAQAISESGVADTKFKWSSSDKKVATVNSKGLVTGKKKGSAVITVTTSNGKTDSITIAVE